MCIYIYIYIYVYIYIYIYIWGFETINLPTIISGKNAVFLFSSTLPEG